MIDTLIAELQREQRHRIVLVVAAVIGIVASVLTGLAYALAGSAAGAGGRNPGALLFFVGPFALAMAIGYAIYGVLRWASRR
jgi:hypothetical protein